MGSIVAEIADKIASAGGGERSELEVRGGVGADGGGILTLSTSELTVVDGDKLGRIDFSAPIHGTGAGDARLVAASIWAEADASFSDTVNTSEIVFAVGDSEAAVEVMRIDHDGQLGIGTATPAFPLSVYVDNATTAPSFLIENDGAGDASMQFLISAVRSYTIGIDNSDSDKFKISLGADFDSSVLMTVDNSGNVGIGVTAPASLLHVAGTVQVGVDDTGHDVIFYGAAAGALMQWDASTDTLLVRGAAADHATNSAGRIVLQTAQTAIAIADVIGRIDFNAPLESSGTDALLVGASIWGVAEAAYESDSVHSALVFATGQSAAAVERMRIMNSGNVGIGTATPGQKLDIAGGVSVTSNIVSPTASGDFSGGIMDWYQGTTRFHSYGANATTEGAYSFGNAQSDGGTAGTLVTITASGKVGIGEASPTQTLTTRTAGDGNHGLMIEKNTVTTSSSQWFISFITNKDANAQANGSIRGAGASTAAFAAWSDVRLKENIVTATGQLSLINQLRPVSFDWKANDESNIGFIANEFINVFPEAVSVDPQTEQQIEDDEAGYYSICGWASTDARLVSAIQELSAKNDALEARILTLENA